MKEDKRYYRLAHLMDYAEYLVEERKHTDNWSPFSGNYSVVGILGELIYQQATGEVMDYRTLENGDGGFDFNHGVDVKASEEHKNLPLIEFTNKNTKPNIYVHVMINLDLDYAYINGWVYGSEFREGKYLNDFGYGLRYCYDTDKLRPVYTYPPILKQDLYELKMLNQKMEFYYGNFHSVDYKSRLKENMDKNYLMMSHLYDKHNREFLSNYRYNKEFLSELEKHKELVT